MLDERLQAVGVALGSEPVAAWLRLHEAEGPRATMIDLYALAAAPRGLLATDLLLEERWELWRSVADVIWPGFAVTADSSRRGDLIEIVDYDPSWPAAYESWRERISGALASSALAIEHVGSTSVPGLPAKAIIDVQVSLADLADEDAYVPQLAEVGLQLRSRDDYHRYFRPHAGQPRSVHTHVCTTGSAWERDHLLFRDYLRTHPADRDSYAKTKRAAALAWSDDGIGYTDAKSETILDIMADAAVWRAAAGDGA